MNKPALPFKLAANGERIQRTRAQIRHDMKPRDISKDIFGLAVRLLGLVFLYFGLSAVPPMLDLRVIETADKSDIINAILPVAFNLVVAWWLIGGGRLMRRDYPETPRILDHSPSPAERAAPMPDSARSQGLTDMDRAAKRLESLVEKPKDGRAV